MVYRSSSCRKSRAVVTLLFLPVLASTHQEQKTITAESGQNVTLTCRAPNNNILVTEWSRADLEPEYVLLYRDERSLPDNQHPSFKNRVDLQDRQMKDGDVSVILKNVTINDTGTYECRIQTRRNRLRRALLKTAPISIIYLRVVAPPGPTGGTTEDGGKEDGGKEDGGKEDGVRAHPGLIAGISVMFLYVAVLIVISKTHKKEKSTLPAPPDKEAEQQLV